MELCFCCWFPLLHVTPVFETSGIYVEYGVVSYVDTMHNNNPNNNANASKMCVHPGCVCVCVLGVWSNIEISHEAHPHTPGLWYQENKYQMPIDTIITCEIYLNDIRGRLCAVRDSKSARGLQFNIWLYEDGVCEVCFLFKRRYQFEAHITIILLLISTVGGCDDGWLCDWWSLLQALVIGHSESYHRDTTVPGWSLASSIDSNREGDGKDNSLVSA